ncbi:MAG: energy transducer TonB [Holophagaceae bacterium]
MLPALLCLPALLAPAQAQDLNAFFAKQDWTGLEAYARARLAAKPKDAAAQNLLGIALGNQGKAADARAAFEAAVALEPRLAQAWFNLAQDRAVAGDGPGTRKAFEGLKKASMPIAAKAADDPAVFALLADPPSAPVAWSLDGPSAAKAPAFPPYPPMAGRAGARGDVVLDLLVDASGTPVKATVLAGDSQLAGPSETFARAWRFAPRSGTGTYRVKLALVYQLDMDLNKLGAGPDLATAAQRVQDVVRGPIPRVRISETGLGSAPGSTATVRMKN